MQVTEHRAQRKVCPNCGRSVTAGFPADVCAPTQYGPGMQAVMSYLNVRQVIPRARTAEICQDLFGHRPSAGSAGVEGFAAAGILPVFQNTLMHDFWGAYDTLLCTHVRCNSHLLRELISCAEDKHIWAEEPVHVLLDAKQATDDARKRGDKSLDPAHRKRLKRRYDKWVRAGLEAHPEQLKSAGKRGRIK